MTIMKKTKNFVLRHIIDEYILVPKGEVAESVRGVMTLSETAAFIYEHLEETGSAEEMAELLGKEYNIGKEAVIEDVQEVLDFLEKNGAMTW